MHEPYYSGRHSFPRAVQIASLVLSSVIVVALLTQLVGVVVYA